MIATGLVLWNVKRRDRHSEQGVALGYRLVEGLNVAVVAGLLVAVAVFFWANRLLPVELAERALWEMRVFFLAWALCALHGFLKRDPQSAWKEQVYSSAALFVLLPLLNVITTQNHLLVTLPNETWRLAGFDLTALAAGVLLGWTARRLGRPVLVNPKSRIAPMFLSDRETGQT